MEKSIMKGLEKQLNMILEETRLGTFTNWPFSSEEKCSSANMAEAGFYYIGDQDDLVTCFLCRKELDGWESNDDPWKEHLNHAPYCMFVKLGKSVNDLTTAQLLDLKQEQLFLALDKYAINAYEADVFELNKFKKALLKK